MLGLMSISISIYCNNDIVLNSISKVIMTKQYLKKQ